MNLDSEFRKNEAFNRMLKGEKVKHKSFQDEEYLQIKEGLKVITEDGFDFTDMFWGRNIAYYEYGWTNYV